MFTIKMKNKLNCFILLAQVANIFLFFLGGSAEVTTTDVQTTYSDGH